MTRSRITQQRQHQHQQRQQRQRRGGDGGGGGGERSSGGAGGASPPSSSLWTGGASISALTRGGDDDDDEEGKHEVVKRGREYDDDGDDDSLWQRRVNSLPLGGGRPVESVAVEAAAAVNTPPAEGAGSGSGGLMTTLLGASPVDADGKPKRRPRYIHSKWLQTSERWLGVFENASAAPSRVYARQSCAVPTVSTAAGAGAAAANEVEQETGRGVGARALAALEAQWGALDRGDKTTTTAPVAGAVTGAGAAEA
jgi:hypothetical protein